MENSIHVLLAKVTSFTDWEIAYTNSEMIVLTN
jgi:hypothetical protein